MALFVILIFLYGIPISLGIMAIYWILSGMKFKNAKIIRNILFIGLGIFIIGATFYNWWSRQHTVRFQFDDQYQIVLHMEEIESFLDAPTEFDMEIENLKSGEEREFKFSTGFGTAFEFSISDVNPHLLMIKGLDRNVGQNYVVNMNKKRRASPALKEIVHRKRLVSGYKIVNLPDTIITYEE